MLYTWALGILAVALIGLKTTIIGVIAGIFFFCLAIIAIQVSIEWADERIRAFRKEEDKVPE